MNHAAICKNRKGEARNGLMGMGGIWMEMWEIWVRMRGMGGMSNLGHSLGIRVEIQGNWEYFTVRLQSQKEDFLPITYY